MYYTIGMFVPSLHRESTDSLIHVQACVYIVLSITLLCVGLY